MRNKKRVGTWVKMMFGMMFVMPALVVGCGGELVPPNQEDNVPQAALCGDQKAEVLSGNLTESRTLTADRRWLLVGQVRVMGGTTLRIEPGTTICGDASDPVRVSFLNIEQDAKIHAEGTREKPIVFTSSRKVGERRTSDWGGVVLRGRAQVNLPPGDATACGNLEGNAGPYGPCGTLRNDDSSGVLKYVRIEFAGREVAPQNELNGLTFGGVGSGTVVDFVQVHRGSDDAFEWFGGTVDVKHLVASAGLDDSFDWDQGYVGRGQFLVSQQILSDGNNGIEADNNRDNNGLTPRSSPVFANLTLVGTGPGTSPKGEKRFGMTLRQGTAGKILNGIVLGFAEMGVTLSQESTCTELVANRLQLQGNLFFGNGRDASANLSTVTLPCDVAAALKKSGNREVNPLLRKPYDLNQPDFRPETGSPAGTDAVALPAGNFFEKTQYVGAFSVEEGTDWTAGWTAYPMN